MSLSRLCAGTTRARVSGMFIRRNQTQKTASGETYHTHWLVRSARVDVKVRQLTLLILGRHFDLDQALRPARGGGR